jgi:hypothetical protein
VPHLRNRWLAWPLFIALAAPHTAAAQDPRAADVPLAVTSQPDPSDSPEVIAPATAEPVPSDTPKVPSPTQPITSDEPDKITVAVGLGPSAPGSKAERTVVDALAASVAGSPAPKTEVRRLRAGAGDGTSVCRERRDDLVILLEYLPDRTEAVLVTRDCRLNRELGVRGLGAASETGLTAVLWDEHRDLVRQGAKERKVRVSPKVRRGLIAGGAILAVGLAIGLVLASSLRRDSVVLTVGP